MEATSESSPSTPPSTGAIDPLTELSKADSLKVLAEVGMPLLARGLIIRRPRMLKLLDQMGADRRGVELLVQLRERYGPGPLAVRIPARSVALVVDPDQVHEILDHSPEPFHPATTEKRAALDHFQPEGVLATSGPERTARRDLNERVLETECPRHSLAERFDRVVEEEARWIAARAIGTRELDWDTFERGWNRVVRRVVLGDHARDDTELTELITRLRKDGNWAFMKPVRGRARNRFHDSLSEYLDRADPGSLASVMADRVTDRRSEAPVQQFPQWLFAFDPAGMATFRALALLAVNPLVRSEALDEAMNDEQRPLLRGTILESLRLWPTTPGILRELTAEHRWPSGAAPEGTTMLIYTPLFHRHPDLADADRFAPRQWLVDRGNDDWPLVPFSGGPAMCPGRNVVLNTTTAMLAALHRRLDVELADPERLDAERLPSTFDPYTLRFAVRPHEPTTTEEAPS